MKSKEVFSLPSADSAWPELRSAMHSRGLSLADLSRATGRPYVTLSKYLCGYSDPPNELIVTLAELLRMKPAELRPARNRGILTDAT